LAFLVLMAGVSAEPLAPRPALPAISRLEADAALLAGADSWPEEEPGTAELRLAGGLSRSLGAGAWALRYGGVMQAWQEGYLLDGHLLELAVEGSGSPSLGGLARFRGSAAWGWAETLLAGAGRLELGRWKGRALVGPAMRGDSEGSSFGLGLGAQSAVRISPRLTGIGLVETRHWTAEDYPAAELEGDLSLRWAGGGQLAVQAGGGGTVALGGKDDAWVAGIPPSGLLTLRGWLAPEVALWRSAYLAVEVSGETAGEDYRRVRLMAGLGARLGRLSSDEAPAYGARGVVFHYLAVGAESVAVAGSFSGWEPLALEPGPGGAWSLHMPLEPGEYEYVYLVDGQPMSPPEATRRRPDGFGGENGVLWVGAE